MESQEMTNNLAEELLNTEIQLRRVNSELERQSEAFKIQLALRDRLNEQIEQAKAKLKEIAPLGKVTRKIGEDELSVNIWKTTRVSEGDIKDMPEEYITEEEIFNVVERNGHFYQKHGNTTLVKNHIQLGMDCPSGFSVKESKAISIKFNGKAL